MPLDAADPLVQLTDQHSVAEHARILVGDRVAERSQAGGEVIELAIVTGDNLAEPGYHSPQPDKLGREIVELAVMHRHRAGDLRQQLADGRDIRPVCTTHATTVAAVTPLGQALRVPRSPDLPCDKVC
jgi:hypothetical protein